MIDQELVQYITDVIKNNDGDSKVCKMALLAEQAILQEDNLEEAVDSIVGVDEEVINTTMTDVSNSNGS